MMMSSAGLSAKRLRQTCLLSIRQLGEPPSPRDGTPPFILMHLRAYQVLAFTPRNPAKFKLILLTSQLFVFVSRDCRLIRPDDEFPTNAAIKIPTCYRRLEQEV
ncbi:hypothetical protein V2G26_016323 [Clonostachys chloroleuca]